MVYVKFSLNDHLNIYSFYLIQERDFNLVFSHSKVFLEVSIKNYVLDTLLLKSSKCDKPTHISHKLIQVAEICLDFVNHLDFLSFLNSLYHRHRLCHWYRHRHPSLIIQDI